LSHPTSSRRVSRLIPTSGVYTMLAPTYPVSICRY
jgi:hypothetical protein